MGNAQQATDVDLQAKPTPEIVKAPTPSNGPANIPELAQLDEIFKQTSVGKEGDEQRLRVEWRQLKNKVANDPDLAAAKRAADTARKDLDKRELLRAYYKLYYVRIRQFPLSPAMKQHIAQMEASQLWSTNQARVRPTPSPSPAAAH
jgi:hypothetical protein